jgi:hypothetical protein
MIDPDEDRVRAHPATAPREAEDLLGYRIELRRLYRTGVKRVRARAERLTVAHAIFRAACSEHFGRHPTLSRAGKVIEQSD